MESIHAALYAFGLGENERIIYLAILKEGKTDVSLLLKKARLPRSTINDNIQKLLDKGLISKIQTEKRIFYGASNPKILIDKLDETKMKVESVLSNLNSMQNTSKPIMKVRHLEGKETMKALTLDMISKKQDPLLIGNYKKFKSLYGLAADRAMSTRIKAGLKMRCVCENSKEYRALKLRVKQDRREIRYNDDLNDLDVELYIYADTVAFISMVEEKPMCVLIESKEIAELNKRLFEVYWRNSKEIT